MTTKIVKTGLLKRMMSILWIVGIIFLFAYGFLAINSGLKLSKSYSDESANQVTMKMREQADRKEPVNQATATQVLPLWMSIAAKSGTEKFVYGSDSITDAYIHYFQMSNTGKFVLSTHMMLGAIIMTFGVLQFWPTFRKKYPKAHRYTGAVYLIAAFSSMSLSIHHLIETGPDKTYGGFAFYMGLWVLTIGSIVSLIAAIYYIKKKDIMRHMGWQALAFSCFLTAPLQRLNWIILPYLFAGHTSFNEMNYVVNVVLLIEAVLMGYVLFYANRSSISKEANTVMTSPTDMNKPLHSLLSGVVATAATIAWILFVAYFVVSPGFANHAATTSLFPAMLISVDQKLHLSSMLDTLYALLGCFSVAGIAFWFVNPLSFVQRSVIYWVLGASFGMVAILWQWTLVMGMPSHTVSAGGTFFGLIASLMALFSLLSVWALRSGRYYLLNEFLLFLFSAVVALPVVYGSAFIINAIGLVPERFIAVGHGYQIAVIAAILPSLLAAYLYAMYATPVRKRNLTV